MKPESSFQSEHEAMFTKPSRRLRDEELPPQTGEIEQEGRIYQGHGPEAYAERMEAEMGPEAREVFEKVLAISRAVQEAGGRALLVGGCVRDEILGMPSKDFDLEIYGIEKDALTALIRRHAKKVETVGQKFEILTIMDHALRIDIALPRREKKIGTGKGRGDYEIIVDPFMDVRQATRRRELTLSSILKDPLTGEIIDPFSGVEDLQHRRLRVTDARTFPEDALRVLRAAQFVSRFGLRIEPETLSLMQGMLSELHELPTERFRDEWDKLLTKGDRPSAGLHALHQIGVIDELYPELAGLREAPHDAQWHPEGDVWTHTLLSVDAAANVAHRHELDGAQKKHLLYAALSHEVEHVEGFLMKVGFKKNEIPVIQTLVEQHREVARLYREYAAGRPTTDGQLRQFAKRLAPASIHMLSLVAEADHLGRGPFLDPQHVDQFMIPDPFVAGDWLRTRAVELGIEHVPAPAPLTGRDLIDLGFKPGIAFTPMTRIAERLRDELGMDRRQIVSLIQEAGTLEQAVEQAESLLSRS